MLGRLATDVDATLTVQANLLAEGDRVDDTVFQVLVDLRALHAAAAGAITPEYVRTPGLRDGIAAGTEPGAFSGSD